MARVILFGGGDGGGLIITAGGVRPIPPFDPGIRLQLRGISALLNGVQKIPDETAREMTTWLNRVSNLIVEQVEAAVGPLDEDNSLIYQDEDGGFSCGSTGRPPIPFPWPASEIPSLGNLIATGVLERELIDFVDAANKQEVKINNVLEDPAAVATQLGIKLSERTIQDLQRLAPSQLEKIANPVDYEIVQFFNKVAEDGRFLATWTTRPYEAATALQIELSTPSLERILAGGASVSFNSGTRENPAVVAVVVGVVIMLVPTVAERGKLEIRDFSGLAKF